MTRYVQDPAGWWQDSGLVAGLKGPNAATGLLFGSIASRAALQAFEDRGLRSLCKEVGPPAHHLGPSPWRLTIPRCSN